MVNHKNIARPIIGEFKQIIVLIEGKSKSGKSTLAKYLKNDNSVYVSMDELILDVRHGIKQIFNLYAQRKKEKLAFRLIKAIPVIMENKQKFVKFIFDLLKEIKEPIIYIDCFGIENQEQLIQEIIKQGNNYVIWRTIRA